MQALADSVANGGLEADSTPLALVVDDDTALLDLLSHTLQRQGLRVAEADSGRAAIEKFDRLSPAIVLLDVAMPGLDGLDTCRAIRSRPAGRNTPIVMLSGRDDAGSIDAAFAAGATDFLAKPPNLALLGHRLRHVLRASAAMGELAGRQPQGAAGLIVVAGLPNHAQVIERLNQMIAHSRRETEKMAVLFLDIDHFRRINDSLGHAAGDAVLAEVVVRIDRCIRLGDTVGRVGAASPDFDVGRLGGDEFCVLLGGLRCTLDAGGVAQRLLDAFAVPFVIGGTEVFLTASIGIAVHPTDAGDGPGLLKAADAALYQAKEEGRNNFQFFDRNLHACVVSRLVLENELRRALDRQEFVLYYQPQVDAATRRVVSLEALVRWKHPERGVTAAADFIAVAEESRLIVRIDQWVLREACRQNRAWQDAGALAVPVAVNLSGHQFARTGLVDDVARALDETGLDPAFLVIEVTEGVLMKDREVVTSNLKRLTDMGVRLSLDDFGTGYSSLSYLKRLPLHELKIDQAFARDVVEDIDSAAIVATIIGIGKTLGLRLVAEGIETEGQAACLTQHGCGVLQGYLFGKPQPAEVVAALLGAGRDRRSAAGAPIA